MSSSDLHQRLLDKDATLAVIGLGYVGLPIALAFARHIRVIGFDIHSGRVEQMKQGIDNEELEADAEGVTFPSRLTRRTSRPPSSMWSLCRRNQYHQPTGSHPPRLGMLIGVPLPGITPGHIYPGCTEEDCVPVLEERSGLTWRGPEWDTALNASIQATR